jgi:hypothetical protein
MNANEREFFGGCLDGPKIRVNRGRWRLMTPQNSIWSCMMAIHHAGPET